MVGPFSDAWMHSWMRGWSDISQLMMIEPSPKEWKHIQNIVQAIPMLSFGIMGGNNMNSKLSPPLKHRDSCNMRSRALEPILMGVAKIDS